MSQLWLQPGHPPSNAEQARAQLQALRERRMKATGGGKTRMATEYLVLEGNEDGWKPLGKHTAVNPKAAIKAALEGDDQEGGTFVAVPARSWQPVTVQVETALKFS